MNGIIYDECAQRSPHRRASRRRVPRLSRISRALAVERQKQAIFPEQIKDAAALRGLSERSLAIANSASRSAAQVTWLRFQPQQRALPPRSLASPPAARASRCAVIVAR